MSRRTSRSKPLPISSGDGSEDLSGGGGACKALRGSVSKTSLSGSSKRSKGGGAKSSLDSAAKASHDGGAKRSSCGAKASLDSAPKLSLDRSAPKSSPDGSVSKHSLIGGSKSSPHSASKRSPDSTTSKSSSPSSGSKSSPSAFESYNSHLFTSSCCHQFNIHEGPMCICSQCKRLITQLKDDEVLTVSVKFNNSLESNVSADIQNSFKLKAKRFATDPTYELCGRKCPKCKSLCRYTRDAQMNILFICSNSSCRYVFNDE